MWPVVHQHLGVRPDLGRARLTVVPQTPSRAPVVGRGIRLGSGWVNVSADRAGSRWITVVDTATAPVRRLSIGHTLPRGSEVASIELDGRAPRRFRQRVTNRGLEVTVPAGPGRHTLVIRTR
jgi:hypothetical protein